MGAMLPIPLLQKYVLIVSNKPHCVRKRILLGGVGHAKVYLTNTLSHINNLSK